jgi:hypothetical protein
MAKIENWTKIRHSILVLKYNPDERNDDLLRRLQFLELESLSIKRQLKRVCVTYLPNRHPLFERKLMEEGRLIELADVKNMGVYLAEKRNIHLIEHIDEINDLANIISQETLDKLRYDGERYRRVTSILYDGREILRVPAVQEDNI